MSAAIRGSASEPSIRTSSALPARGSAPPRANAPSTRRARAPSRRVGARRDAGGAPPCRGARPAHGPWYAEALGRNGEAVHDGDQSAGLLRPPGGQPLVALRHAVMIRIPRVWDRPETGTPHRWRRERRRWTSSNPARRITGRTEAGSRGSRDAWRSQPSWWPGPRRRPGGLGGALVVALLFSAIILAAALRPGVDRLAERGFPRGIGVVLHYAVSSRSSPSGSGSSCRPRQTRSRPPSATSVGSARRPNDPLGSTATSSSRSTGKLSNIPSGSSLVDPAVEYGTQGVRGDHRHVLRPGRVPAYSIIERNSRSTYVLAAAATEAQNRSGTSWDLIELRLGAVRSPAGGAGRARGDRPIGLLLGNEPPYWLLVGVFAGGVENSW